MDQPEHGDPRRPACELRAEILGVLWAAGHAVTAADL
jgi:hypothetical protein